MIILKLTRDQARSVQLNFFPYLSLLCEKNIRDTTNPDETLNARMIYCILNEIRKDVEKKLFNTAKKIKFKFSDAQAIVMYKLMIALPLQPDQIWLINLRQHIVNILHIELCEPIEIKQPVETGH